MALWDDFPSTRYFAWGTLAERPLRPDAKVHGYFAWDSASMFIGSNNREWLFAGGSFPRSVTTTLKVTSAEQIVAHRVNIAAGGKLVIEGTLVLV